MPHVARPKVDRHRPAHVIVTGVDRARLATRASAKKKAAAWAEWALGKDQSPGMSTSNSRDSGRARRKSSLRRWATMVVAISPNSGRLPPAYPLIRAHSQKSSAAGPRT